MYNYLYSKQTKICQKKRRAVGGEFQKKRRAVGGERGEVLMLGTRENYWGFRVRQNLIWGGEDAST